MKKIFEHIDFSRVGHFQSILEHAGITTHIKNLGASGASGEIPFHEVWPELWVVDEADYPRAISVLESYEPPETEDLTDWVCQKCKEEVGKEFGECWNCGTIRPETEPAAES